MKNFIFFAMFVLVAGQLGCSGHDTTVVAVTGIQKVKAEVDVGSDGMTSEQRNIKERLRRDNKPGAIKHLYVFSAMSGQCLIYSTVKEKVTSSGKRLSPTTAIVGANGEYKREGFWFDINGKSYVTAEVLQDDGTYGHSIDYLYWTDSSGKYHQHYLSGGQIVHISDEPMPVKSVIINLESTK